MKIDKHLYIFNLETNADSFLLSHTHDWINEFAAHVEFITVFSVHVGRHNLPSNVIVKELGGGSKLKRLGALFNLLYALTIILKNKKSAIVFYHMIAEPAALIGAILRLFLIPQGIWYSHSVLPISLKIAMPFMNKFFSSTPLALPFSSLKSVFCGHGIEISEFTSAMSKSTKRRKGIVSVGRISEIKHIENLINLVSKSALNAEIITLIGPYSPETSYYKYLSKLAITEKVEVIYKGAIAHKNLPVVVSQFSMAFTGNPNTVDKAAIESAICGCFILCEQEEILELIGMDKIWDELGYKAVPNITDQIRLLSNLNEDKSWPLRIKLSNYASNNNNIQSTAKMIIDTLSKVYSR